jgi:hypothetical protein
LIEYLNTYQAIFGERHYFFQQKQSRNNAWSLIQSIDLGWQIARTFGGVDKSDVKWFQSRMHQIELEEINPQGFEYVYGPMQRAVQDISWAYELNSCLRHPLDNAPKMPKLLQDPWTQADNERLLNAADMLGHTLTCLTADLVGGNGFVPEIEAKQILMANAKTNQT